MNVLVLGGMSPRHHEWVRGVAEALKPHMEEVVFLDYRHWQTGEEMDIEYEITQTVALAARLGEYIVVAKSIGTVITTLATSRGMLSSQRCLFMGFPLSVVEQYLPEVAEALKDLPPTTFLHNEADPLGSSKAVQAYLGAHTPPHFDFKVLPGSTHDYVDFNLITQLAIAK
jgi:predicted alpha/beta-hydrolase family hydrolase